MNPLSKKPAIENALISFQKYRYTPLSSTSPNTIRFLRLHPAPDPTWPIRCSIFETNLLTAPPYIALSYSWGTSSSPKRIIIGTSAISVTQSLHFALQRLRPKSGELPLIIWADAICINQEDILERNIQTANMRAIYQHASSVAVWLGLTHHGSMNAMNLASELSSTISLQEAETIILNPDNRQHIEDLVLLFRRQYWWRIWVIQEVSCAKTCTVYCGPSSISWISLDRICDIFKELEHHLTSFFYAVPSYTRTLTHGGPRSLQLSRYSPTSQLPPLLELLTTHKSKKSTDPKDKVYALVGISSSHSKFGQINYSSSVREIYTHTTKHIITSTSKLDVICVKQHNVPNFNLPTWVTDWTRPPPNSGATLVGLHHHEPFFRAAGDSKACVSFSSDGYTLKARGFLIDTISTVGHPCKRKGAPGKITRVLHVFRNWWDIYTSTFPSAPQTHTAEQAKKFGLTISCGTWVLPSLENYREKLSHIFALSTLYPPNLDEEEAEDEFYHSNPPSRTSTFPRSSSNSTLSNSTTLSSSITSLQQDIDLETFIQDSQPSSPEEENSEKARMESVLSAGLMMNRRRLFVSEKGRVGMALWFAEVGDCVVVLFGCRFPVVLRWVAEIELGVKKEGEDVEMSGVGEGGRRGKWILIGEAYVDGFMDGEGMEGLERGEYEVEEFEIA